MKTYRSFMAPGYTRSKIETLLEKVSPDLKKQVLDQIELIEEGVDAYIDRYYRKDKDEVWYRVRVGNFKNKAKAKIFQKQIESISGIKTWLDIIPQKNNKN